MPIALVSHGENANWTATPGTTLATSAFVVNTGNTIVVVVNNIPTNATMTDTAGNVYNVVTVGAEKFWLVTNAKANAANVLTMNSPVGLTFTYLAAACFSGCDLVNPVDTAAFTSFGQFPAIQNPFSPAISTRWPTEVLFAWVQSSDLAVTGAGGYTLISNPASPTSNAQLLEYQLVSSIQTNVQATATESALANWGMGIIALVGTGQRPASAGGDLGPGYDFKFRM